MNLELRVATHRGEHPLVAGHAATERLDRLLRERAGRGLIVVTDENVAGLVLPKLRERHPALTGARTLVRRAGEEHKGLAAYQELLAAFAAAGLRRDGCVLALGGGMITDLAGFAAATWLRGIDWLALPTSLVGQVDAAIGGKTGIDLAAGKNLIGAFHPPREVLIDPAWLATLPEREWRSGFGELLKYALVDGEKLLAQVAGLKIDDAAPALHAVMARALAIKIDLVRRDEFDRGPRLALNLGHTIGHAIETGQHYRGLTHGEAVAVGLIAEAHLAERLGIAQVGLSRRVAEAASRLGLPRRATVAAPDRARAALALDKKQTSGGLRMALPRSVGEIEIVEVNDAAAIEAALMHVLRPE